MRSSRRIRRMERSRKKVTGLNLGIILGRIRSLDLHNGWIKADFDKDLRQVDDAI